jgi:PEGA domain
MAKHLGIACALTAALALGLPSPATAQAAGRGSRTSGSSSSGSSGSASSGQGRVSSPASPQRSAPTRTPSSGATRVGTARSSSAPPPPPPGGRTGSSVAVTGSRTGGTASSGSATAGSSTVYRGTRDRGDRPAIGTAANRRDAGFVSFPLFGPWGRWYPWYTSGFGGLGFVTYNPWRYGATRWVWGRYGLWYDPYAYYPYGYYSSYSPYGAYYASSRGSGRNGIEEPETGSIRLRVKPATAKVYIDGALAGIVDEFDGLTNHLELSPGVHQIELRADGYDTYVGQITVEAGKTLTERLSLKKK